MAIHIGSLPRFRQAPLRGEAFRRRPSEGESTTGSTTLARLNQLTADASTRLRATSIFILGLTAFVAAMAIF